MIGQSTAAPLPVVSINGELTPGDGLSISPRDRGFTLADGLFETMRVQAGVVFRLDRHLARLSDGLRVMQIPQPAELRVWVLRAVAHAGIADGSVRLTVTRGPGRGGLAPPDDAQPTTAIAVGPKPHVDPDIYRVGLRSIVSSGRRNPRSMSAGLKTLSYTDAVLAWLEARRAGADEALLLDTDGHCSEATASNLFVLHRETLLTPPPTCAALPGITREAVLELADELNIRTQERAFGLEELHAAAEVFLTSSLRGIAPVSSIDGRPVGSGAVGAVTAGVTKAYDGLVRRECGTA